MLHYNPSVNVVTTNLAGLASSGTLLTGRALAEIPSVDGLLDREIGGKITVGSTVTTGQGVCIEIWLIPKLNDSTWPDAFDGTDKAITITTRNRLFEYGRQVIQLPVDVTTANIAYPFWFSAREVFGTLPSSFQIFITHNTGSALNATATNHIVSHTAITDT